MRVTIDIDEALQRLVRGKRQAEALQALKDIGWEGDLDAMRTDLNFPPDEPSPNVPEEACASCVKASHPCPLPAPRPCLRLPGLLRP